ncbi:MAG: (d)CMP kinase, partial [Clostridiales bacterium]|nr:(d)CMP kinase [Clostridiales bacterium]
DVTDHLRDEAVGNMASVVAQIPVVRSVLLDLQRKLARENDVVMDGRDIGTCVLPDAELKVYLTASSAVRAKRRYDELVAKGENPDISVIEKDIIERDERDMNREIAPLKQAEDAVLVDSSYMTIDEVADRIISLAADAGAKV